MSGNGDEGASLLSLISAHKSRGVLRLRTRRFRDGGNQTVVSRVFQRSTHHAEAGSWHPITDPGSRGQVGVGPSPAGLRAAAVVRRIVRESGHDHMLTFTFPATVTEFGESAWLMREWMHRKGAALVRQNYVIVPEQHEDGRWHFHMAYEGFVPVMEVRQSWTAFLVAHQVELPPSVREVQVRATYYRPSRRRKGSDLGNYLAKYVTKTFDNAVLEPGQHRYSVGAAASRPAEDVDLVLSSWPSSEEEAIELWRSWCMDAEVSVVGVWFAPERECLVLTWDAPISSP